MTHYTEHLPEAGDSIIRDGRNVDYLQAMAEDAESAPCSHTLFMA